MIVLFVLYFHHLSVKSIDKTDLAVYIRFFEDKFLNPLFNDSQNHHFIDFTQKITKSVGLNRKNKIEISADENCDLDSEVAHSKKMCKLIIDW